LAIDRGGDVFVQGGSYAGVGGSGVFEIEGNSISSSSHSLIFSDSSQSLGSVGSTGFSVISGLGGVSQIDSSGNLNTVGLIAAEGSQGACLPDGQLYCNSDGVTTENRNYFCDITGLESGSCTYSVSGFENCATKTTFDSDGSSFNLGGFVHDYIGCSTGDCTYNQYNDYCSGSDVVVDYRSSGSSISSASFNCNSNNYNYCSGLNYRYVDYNCGFGAGGCSVGSDSLVQTCIAPGPAYGSWSCSDSTTAVRSMTTYAASCSAGSGCGVSSFSGTDTDSCSGTDICSAGSGCGAPSDCSYGISHGSSGVFFSASSVSFGDSCSDIDQVRSCYDGSLTGSFTHQSCIVGAAPTAVCGSRNGNNYNSLSSGSSNLCSSGSVSGFGLSGNVWSWDCNVLGPNDVSCSAGQNVAGVCGFSDGTCDSGSLSGYSGAGDTTWSCNGINDGTDASCSAAPTCTVSSWSPSTSTECSGDSFTQTSNCGTTRGATGTSTSGVCAPTCTVSSWGPSTSTECSGDSFTQTSNCGTTRGATGTSTSGVCAPTCTVSSWGPSTSTECSGDSFTQTSNCGTTRGATGTSTSGFCAPTCSLPLSLGGGSIPDGSGVTAYSTSSPSFPTLCNDVDQTRTCSNGVLSGSYSIGSCTNPPIPVCGNGVVEGVEVCDDGNTANGDGCSSTCSQAYCSSTVSWGPGSSCSALFQVPYGTLATQLFDNSGTYQGQAGYQCGSAGQIWIYTSAPSFTPSVPTCDDTTPVVTCDNSDAQNEFYTDILDYFTNNYLQSDETWASLTVTNCDSYSGTTDDGDTLSGDCRVQGTYCVSGYGCVSPPEDFISSVVLTCNGGSWVTGTPGGSTGPVTCPAMTIDPFIFDYIEGDAYSGGWSGEVRVIGVSGCSSGVVSQGNEGDTFTFSCTDIETEEEDLDYGIPNPGSPYYRTESDSVTLTCNPVGKWAYSGTTAYGETNDYTLP
jgi:cysteine-rich repeat protein